VSARKPATVAPVYRDQVAQFVARLADRAESGEVTDAFVVMRGQDGSYAETYLCDDLDEMLLEVGSAKIRGRIELQRERSRGAKS
jgi:hypothetical protein